MANKITKNFLEARLALVVAALGLPSADVPYGTAGKLMLSRDACGYIVSQFTEGGGEYTYSRGMSAAECSEFLGGMLAAASIIKTRS